AKVFYATTEDEDDSAVLYKYDPKLEHLREIMRLRRRTPIVFGRHGELYLVKDGAVTQLDTKQNSDRPAILRQFDLKGAMPEAMVYEDGADEVTLLFTEKRRLLTLSRDLSPVRERPLPSQVKFVGEGLMTNSSLDKKVWLASTKSQSFYQLNQIPGKDGQWQVEQTITLPGVNNPTSLQVSESGNLIVVEAGKVHEFAYDERTRRWTDAPKSYVAGMRTGKRLVLARSRTNFDAKWMTGPGWTNYEPEAIDETGETPDCPADLTGSTDPRNPMWGMPDGMVDAGDYTYFLKQYERGNLLVTDLTGSKDPQDLLRYGAPDGRLTAADVLYYHERHANSLGYCPEGKNSK
ncbi:MAG: GC-type dockerin domain-anchored protein, partial [Candidatus Binatia bacterium]